MADLPEEHVDLTLSQAEALVLFELLARYGENGSLGIEDPAEQQALLGVLAALERQLVTPLMSNYAELLETARAALRPGTA